MHDSVEKISAGDIIADVLVALNDEGYSHGLTPGFYDERLKQVVQNLHIKLYLERTYIDLDIPENLIIPIPADFFNCREAYIHFGDCCTANNASRLIWKRQYRNQPGGTNYTATRNNNGMPDPFTNDWMYGGMNWVSTIPGMYWGNIDSGYIMLSDNVRFAVSPQPLPANPVDPNVETAVPESNRTGFTKIRLIYNSMGGDFRKVPMVPRLIQELVLALTILDCLPYIKMKCQGQPDLYRMYADLERNQYTKIYTPYDGLWDRYRTIITSMSTWEGDNFSERTFQTNR